MSLYLFAFVASASAAAPIIGGQGKYRYQYMPELLQLPAGTVLVNAHGLVVDNAHNIYLTYENDHKKDPNNCLIRWNPDGTGGIHMTGGNATLCSGTPHGLKIATEWTRDGHRDLPVEYLYHANNNQKLTKTTLDGTIIWQRNGNFTKDQPMPYRPTWFAVPPRGNYIYLCDGYGSNNVYVFDRYNGTFMNRTFGGRGGRNETGKFSTNHGCTYDPRSGKIAVSDRANSRFQYFDYDPLSPDKFEYSHTVDMLNQMGKGTLPCNLRINRRPHRDSKPSDDPAFHPLRLLETSIRVSRTISRAAGDRDLARPCRSGGRPRFDRHRRERRQRVGPARGRAAQAPARRHLPPEWGYGRRDVGARARLVLEEALSGRMRSRGDEMVWSRTSC